MPALARRAPPPVQVEFGRVAAAAQFHATAASPASKSGAFTGGRRTIGSLSGKLSLTGTVTGDSFMSRMSSQESDYRYLEMHADQTLSVPIAQLRVDGQVLEATIELQAAARRLLKRTMYCELFPWCEAAPMHPAERMRLPALLPSVGNCHTGTALGCAGAGRRGLRMPAHLTKLPAACARAGVYTYPFAQYHVEFEETPHMWRCVPSKALGICRRCGQPAKCGLQSVHGYSMKSNPSGYACRDAKTTRGITGKVMVSLTSTGFAAESHPTGFDLTREDTFAAPQPAGASFSYVPKGTIVLAPGGRQDPAARLEHLDAKTGRTRTYLDETREHPLLTSADEAPMVKAKLWPRLAAAKIQRALRAHHGRVLLRALVKAKWDRLNLWASTTIQCSWMMHVARAQVRRKEAMIVVRRWISENPTVQLQRVVRGHFGRVAFRFELERTRQWRNIPKIQVSKRSPHCVAAGCDADA